MTKEEQVLIDSVLTRISHYSEAMVSTIEYTRTIVEEENVKLINDYLNDKLKDIDSVLLIKELRSLEELLEQVDDK